MKNISHALFVSIFVFSIFSTADATVYKSIDKDGNVTYSDSPTPTAEKLDLPPVPVMNITPSPSLQAPEDTETKPPQTEAKSSYQLTITYPENNAIIRENSGNIDFTLSLSPDLADNHSILITSSNKELLRTRSLDFTIPNMDRGSHSIIATVIDKSDKALTSSPSINFQLHRHSLINRQGN